MSRTPGILFGFLAIVILAVIVWARRDDSAAMVTEPEVIEETEAVAAAPVAADPAPAPAEATTPAVAGPATTPGGQATPVEGEVIAAIARGPGLGIAATAEEVARLNISIPPDGRNLPVGRGTAAEGAAIYGPQCSTCHGSRGAGGEGMIALTGGLGTLETERPVKTVASFWPYATTLFDYIRRAMPLNAPQTLTDDQVYALVAFLLSVDDILPIGFVVDQTTLPEIQMPNRDGFVDWWTAPGVAEPTRG